MSSKALEEMSGEIRRRVSTRMQRDGWPGVAVGVDFDGAVHVETCGMANLELAVSVGNDTVFRIGSVTKQFTAALILELQELGRLSVHDDVTRHLPDYPTQGRRITLHHLLTHTSGIQSYTGVAEFFQRMRDDLSHDALLNMFQNRPHRFAPGEDFEYNNSGYYLLGMIVEKLFGKSLRHCLAEHVFEPLDLTHTEYLNNSPIVPNRASGYERVNGHLRNAPYLSMRAPFAAGALGSTVGDLLTWQRALNRGDLISRSSVETMRTVTPLTTGVRQAFAYGVAVADFEHRQKITHGGGINGFSSVLSHYPAERLTIAVLINITGASPGPLDSEIARLLLAIPTPTRHFIELKAAELAVYAGSYTMRDQPVPITVDSGGLSVLGQRYLPHGDHRFGAEHDPDSELHFDVQNGVVHGARIEREGIETRLQRT